MILDLGFLFLVIPIHHWNGKAVSCCDLQASGTHRIRKMASIAHPVRELRRALEGENGIEAIAEALNIPTAT
jgi:hypothetical protein